ncbi:MAG: PAC2 family protein [Planctomycetota bacterium]
MSHADPRETWLLAAWPGPGEVALLAARFLVAALEGRPALELPPQTYFDPTTTRIDRGLVEPSGFPRGVFYEVPARLPGGRKLLVLICEGQPRQGGYRLCEDVLDLAAARGATRVVTFSAVGTDMRLQAAPRAFGVVNDRALLAQVRACQATPLLEGEMRGLAAVLLAAAQRRGLPGLCLLGEFPWPASRVPNPRSAAAVLEAFGRHAGLSLDAGPLLKEAQAFEQRVRDLIANLGSSFLGEAEPAAPAPAPAPARRRLSPSVRERIEDLFSAAAGDRSQALALKQLLDHHGVFRRYEDRFLDLFRSAS